jgi:hypothetical protein
MIIIFAVLLELKYFATNSPYGNGELTAIVDDKPPGKCFMRIKTYPSKVGYFIMPKASTFKAIPWSSILSFSIACEQAFIHVGLAIPLGGLL